MQPFKDMWFKDGYTLNKMTMYYSPQFTDIETALITAIDKDNPWRSNAERSTG